VKIKNAVIALVALLSVAALIVFYGLQRAADSPKAGPPFRVLVEIDIRKPIAQNKYGNLRFETLAAVEADSLYRQKSLTDALEAIAYSENLEVSQHIVGTDEKGHGEDCDAYIEIISTAESGDDKVFGAPPLRTEMLNDCPWSAKGKIKVGEIGKYGDDGAITPSDIAQSARRWRMKHFWRYLF
jgi:hypothetical protein